MVRSRYAVLFLAAILVLSHPAAAQEEGAALSGRDLVLALREGGYSIYFRHAATSWSQNDHVRAAGDWRSCDPARMRQLSDEGREEARRVGAAIRALGLPVGRVLASEYCRAAETARLMGLGPVETTAAIVNLRAAEFHGGRAAVVRRLRGLLADPPAPGTNTVLVGHGNVIRAATEVYPGEAGAAIFRPDGNGSFSFVARPTPADWAAMARAHGRAR